MDVKYIINLLLAYVGTAVYLGGAILIFIQSLRGSRYARAWQALSLTLLMWAVLSLLPIFGVPLSGQFIDIDPMSVITLCVGGFSVIISMLYPLELSQPGWITTRNVIKLLLPFTLLTLLYFLVLAIQGQPARELENIPDLLNNLTDFDIWFRFVLYAAVCLYLAYMLINTSSNTLRLHKEAIGDHTPIDPQLRGWLHTYGIGQVCIAITYFGLLIHGTPAVQILHHAVSLIFFSIVIYMVGFSNSQPPKTKAK